MVKRLLCLCVILILAVNAFANNAAPVADADGTYTEPQGDDWVGSIVDWDWDLDNDGQYDDYTGETPTVPWARIVALGLDDVGTYTIGLKVTDNDSGTDTDSTTMAVTNVAPVINSLTTTNAEEDLARTRFSAGQRWELDASDWTDVGGIVSYNWDYTNDSSYDLLDLVSGGADGTIYWWYNAYGTTAFKIEIDDGSSQVDDTSANFSVTYDNVRPFRERFK